MCGLGIDLFVFRIISLAARFRTALPIRATRATRAYFW